MINQIVSKINNHETGTKVQREDLLLSNKEIINSLILENSQKKDKSFISIRELEILKEYESNLLLIMETCPPNLLKQLVAETSSIPVEEVDLDMTEEEDSHTHSEIK
jgi:hypothetical protein